MPNMELPGGHNLLVWDAENSPGEPLCIGGDSDDPIGLSVNLYVVNDNVVGVLISDMTGEYVGNAGLVPAAAIFENV